MRAQQKLVFVTTYGNRFIFLWVRFIISPWYAINDGIEILEGSWSNDLGGHGDKNSGIPHYRTRVCDVVQQRGFLDSSGAHSHMVWSISLGSFHPLLSDLAGP